ncbi:MAG TPA: hypothetical protein VG711_00810 [Phycisphaerales bacterium]|nr:hypothetical protein [Phycisphaerales bacterium]
MTQFNSPPVRRAGGDMDVYTGLLFVATLVMAAGAILMAMRNSSHSESKPGANDGGMLKLVSKR